MNNILLIISREYTTRVKKKGFIIATLLMPLFFAAISIAPAMLSGVGAGHHKVLLIDETARLTGAIAGNASVTYEVTDIPLDSALRSPDYGSVLVIGENAIENPSEIILYSHDAPGIETLSRIKDDLKDAIEDVRLSDLGHSDIKQILQDVEADVQIATLNVDENGNAESSDTLTGFIIGFAMTFILYMFIIIYGNMVMGSIIEEKNNRVLEIIVTSVKPFHLMLGKLIGIGAVAVTQVLIWIVLIVLIFKFLLPSIASPSALMMLSMLTNVSYLLSISGYLLVFLFGGFLLYASIYAAIGAAVDNAQDGSQLQTFAIIPVIIGFVFSVEVAQNPNTELATILSIVPLTSPMAMMARIPSGVPAIEIIASILLLAVTIAFVIWFTAKIYRVGIFMYGKKPTIKELVKWARYK